MNNNKIKIKKVIRVLSENLDSDRCLLSTLINISEDISIDNYDFILQKDKKNIVFDLSDIFMQDCINVPSLEPDDYIRYSTTRVSDLKPFIKALSWKNPGLLVMKQHEILNNLSYMIMKIEKNKNDFFYFHNNAIDGVYNICGDVGLSIKYEYKQEQKRFFGLFNNKLIFSNFNQMNDAERNDAESKINIILDTFYDQ